jgi:hypothetical protein
VLSSSSSLVQLVKAMARPKIRLKVIFVFIGDWFISKKLRVSQGF